MSESPAPVQPQPAAAAATVAQMWPAWREASRAPGKSNRTDRGERLNTLSYARDDNPEAYFSGLNELPAGVVSIMGEAMNPEMVGQLATAINANRGTVKDISDRKKQPTQKQLAKNAMKSAITRERKGAMKAVRERIKEAYPNADYGRMTTRLPRYTDVGISMFGETYDSATPAQLQNRAMYGWTGDGEYFRGNGMYMTGPQGTVMRPTNRFSGEGGFFDDLGNFFVRAGKTILPVAKDVARVAAPVIGNAIAPGIGGMVGSAAANAFLGEGQYETDNPMNVEEPVIKYNNLINHGSVQTKGNAIITSAGDETGDLIFEHNEYIHDLTSRSNDFHTLERFEINPGVFTSFPLLSQFAQHFEEYDFIQCIFEFKSLVTNGNSTAAGSVMLCPNYNASNPNLPDKRSIENASGSVSGKVTGSLFCGIECANDKTAYGGIKYVRTVDIDSAGRRMYDLGFLQIATQGVPEGLAIGELWCRYKVRLSKMKVGALKLPAVGSGVSLQCIGASAIESPFNVMPFSNLPAFTHTPTMPDVPAGGTLLAGDDIASTSLTNADSTDPINKRLLTITTAVVGGSQMTLRVGWQELWISEAARMAHGNGTRVFYNSTQGSDCTIPYTITNTFTDYDNSYRTADPATNQPARYCESVYTIVFGTPGQIGKMNLRLAVSVLLPSPILLDNVITSNWNVSLIRNA